jgi:hypothetical protein
VNRIIQQAGQYSYLSIGFGSFHFQVTDCAPSRFTGLEYLDWVEEHLSRFPTVTVVEVSADELFEREEFGRPNDHETYRNRGLTFPSLEFGEIKFVVQLPKGIQTEVTRANLPLRSDLGDAFVVCIRDGWQMPTASVWAPGCRDATSASEAVRLIREYMRWEESKWTKGLVEFDALGPSPAHFTVELECGDSEQKVSFEMRDRRTDAYEHYVFAYDPAFKEPAVAVAEFHAALIPELDLLYRISRAGAHRARLWNRALMQSDEVLSAYRTVGPLSPLKRVAQGSRINRSMIDLAEMALGQTQEIDQLRDEFTTTYEGREPTYVKLVLQDELREFRPLPTAPLLALLERFDARRQTGKGIAIAAVASLIGAIVAAIATLIASGGSSS